MDLSEQEHNGGSGKMDELQAISGRRRLFRLSPTKSSSKEASPKRKRSRKLVSELVDSDEEQENERVAAHGSASGAEDGEEEQQQEDNDDDEEQEAEPAEDDAEEPLPAEVQSFMEQDDSISVLSLVLNSIGANSRASKDEDENDEQASDVTFDQLLYAAVENSSCKVLEALLDLPPEISEWRATLQRKGVKRSKSDVTVGTSADDRFMFTLMTDASVLVEYDVGSVTTPLHTAFQLQKTDMQTLICTRCPDFAIACLVAQNPEDSADHMLHALASCGDSAAIATCFCALQGKPVPADPLQLNAIRDPALLEVITTTDAEGSTCLHWAVEEGHLSVVEVLLQLNPQLLSQPDANGTTPLHSAAVMGRTDVCKVLVEQGADVCAKDVNGWIPLLYSLLRDEVSTSMGLMKISRAHTVDQLRALATLLNDRAAYLQQEPQLRQVLEKLAIVPEFSAMFNKILQQEHGILEEMRGFLQSYPFLMDLGTKLACMASILAQNSGSFMFASSELTYAGAVRISRTEPWTSFMRYLRREADAQGRAITNPRSYPPLPAGLSHETLIFRNNFLLQFQGEDGVGRGVDREAIESITKDLVEGDAALFAQAEDHQSFQPAPMSADPLHGYDTVADFLENFDDVVLRAMKSDPGYAFFGGLVGHLLLRAAASVWHEGEIGSQALLNVNLNSCFWRLILNRQGDLEDLADLDASLYQNLKWLLQNDGAENLALTFSVNNPSNPSQVILLKPGGDEIVVTDENKHEYIQLVTQFHLKVRMGCQAALIQEGLFATMTSECAYLFNERELALLLAGSPDVDVEDWKAHATYTGYEESDPQIEWLWKLISELGPEERSLLLRFATGSSRAPPSGFRGMSPRFNVTAVEYDEKAALPRASTCFSMLKLPRYPSEALLRKNIMIAIRHGTEGFSFL